MKLIVAEKPIAGKRIADILGKTKIIKTGSVECYQFDDSIIVPLKGHVVDVDFPKEMNNWQKTALSDLVDGKIEYNPSIPGIKRALQKYAKKSDEVIIATDFDREGESIGKEAIDMVKQKNPKIVVKRAKFSALTPTEVNNAFDNLIDFDYDLADAADSRREIDLIWGAVLTRYISLTGKRYGKQFLSVGRVQTPVLSYIVDREKEIKAFKPKDFWTISLDCEKDEKKFNAVYKKDKLFDKDEAGRIAELKSDEATVEKVSKKKTKARPPTPFNTTEFMRAASNIGHQPRRAMSIAEKLYMNGFTSYPRTDNTHYPDSLDLREIVKKLSGVPEFKELAEKILKKKKLVPTTGKKKATDHPPIHPVEVADKKKLQSPEWKIYELIVRRFLATLSDESESENLNVSLKYCDEDFIAKGKRILVPGWREFYHYSKFEEVFLPELNEGDTVRVHDIESEEKQTKPKPRYSPAALIKIMDDNNLGTKSTRAEIIQKLVNRGYVVGQKQFTPTNVAFTVVDTLGEYSEEITKPIMTSALEEEMNEVEEGKKKKTEVVEDSRKMLHKVLDKLEKHTEKIGEKLREARKDDFIIGKCSKCGGNLVIIRSRKTRKQFVGCSNYSEGCRNSFPLPQMAKIMPTGDICEKCGTPIINVIRAKRRPFKMCIDMHCETKKDWGKKKEKKETEKKTTKKKKE